MGDTTENLSQGVNVTFEVDNENTEVSKHKHKRHYELSKYINWSSYIIAASGSLQHVDLMCHPPRFYQKLTEKIGFFCFHDFLLIFSKISFYSCVGSLQLIC